VEEGTMLKRNTPEQELKNRFAQLCVDIIVMAQDLEESWDKIEPLSADLRVQTQQLGDASAELAATIRLRLIARMVRSDQSGDVFGVPCRGELGRRPN